MAVKLRNTIILTVLLPCAMYLINPAVFDFLVYLFVLFICGKSLLKLFMYNFASDEELDSFEAALQPTDRGEALLRRVAGLCMTVFLVLFFAGKGMYNIGIIKYAALSASALWVFDLLKGIFGYFSLDIEEDYNCWDIFLEAVMWLQNILSAVVVMALLLS